MLKKPFDIHFFDGLRLQTGDVAPEVMETQMQHLDSIQTQLKPPCICIVFDEPRILVTSCAEFGEQAFELKEKILMRLSDKSRCFQYGIKLAKMSVNGVGARYEIERT